MGTVGLSFGSPTSGAGFDVASTVSQIVANMRNIEAPWKNQLTALQSQDTVFTQIGTDLSALASDLQQLTSPQGNLLQMDGSSSDNSVVTITNSDTTAVAGSHTIVVTQLAQTASEVSDVIANASDTLSGSLTINGKTLNIDSADNDTTLATLVTAINSGSYGVTASIITDSSGSRLSLISNTSGAGGAITMSSSMQDTTSGSSIGFSVSQAGQDAKLTVDGVQVSSASNSVSTVIPGITFQLLSTNSTSNPVQLQIVNDTSKAGSAITQFINDYNTVIKDLNSQEGNDASGNPEPLFGNPTVATLQEQLQAAVTSIQSSGSITSLAQLHITMSSDGTLSTDDDGNALNAALSSNFQGVANLFQPGNGFTSLGDTLTSVLNNLGTSQTDGVLALAEQQNANQEKQLNTNISNEETTITAQQATLTNELNEANFVLTEIPQQIQNINEIYSAITGFNQSQNG
jgi:flagellar hook-associated protein 2